MPTIKDLIIGVFGGEVIFSWVGSK